MNLTGQVLRFYMPEFVRRRALRELFRSTATALGASMPAMEGASADELLHRYALFTAEEAAVLVESGCNLQPTRYRLYDSAHAIGTSLRHELHITSARDSLAVARAVYRALRIDFRPTPEGDVRIPRCYFSDFYSAPVCHLMSALDQGLLAGLSGGGRFEFQRRMTEGEPCCVAGFLEPPS